MWSFAVQNCSGGFPASNCFPLSFALWMLALASWIPLTGKVEKRTQVDPMKPVYVGESPQIPLLKLHPLFFCELVDHSASMKKKRKSCSSSSFGGAVHHEERDFWIPPKKGIVAGGDPDCNGWNDKQNELCYDCQSCQASFVYNIKQQWRSLAFINVCVLILPFLVYIIGCCAQFSNSSSSSNRNYLSR
ncbi:unnamed protein product [Linum trigynum]|uniref:Uncharacterized protein n=1 Tax=Linum trigynum TaxID=586398 RepID=A0AAV2GBT4_9ROSI